LSTAYDELRVALEAYNEGPDREIGENMVHAAVRKIVRARRRAIERVADFEDVCQEVELSIALTMREHRRKVIDVLKEVSTIVERRIIDVNGRSKISCNTTAFACDPWAVSCTHLTLASCHRGWFCQDSLLITLT